MHYPLPLAIVDTETTGLNPANDRVIEIGIVRIENGAEVGRFSSLIYPECALPSVITGITGITDEMLADAPTFDRVADDVLSFLDGAIFVAHNAQFDMGFLQNEFARTERGYDARSLCSVRLSRALYPEHSRHDLASIIGRFGLVAGDRHRAEDDADVVWQFLRHAARTTPKTIFDSALAASMR